MADNVSGGRTCIGYVPESYTDKCPVMEPITVNGSVRVYSNGEGDLGRYPEGPLTNARYSMAIDTEAAFRATQEAAEYAYDFSNAVAGLGDDGSPTM